MTAVTPALDTLDDAYDTLIDARSPGEFADDHVPGAINLPVMNDEERARVGWLYKQVSPFDARKEGAAIVARNIAAHLDGEFLSSRPKGWRPLVYCARGGMRSGSLTHILREVGWSARRLEGGYKTWRNHVLSWLETQPAAFRYITLAGPTGSAKSRTLAAIAARGGQVLDLEDLAAHKGSVLGELPDRPQPPQRWFETCIYDTLRRFDPARPVFVESESRVVGRLRLPEKIFAGILGGERVNVDAPLPVRASFLLRDYDYFCRAETLVPILERLVTVRGRAQVEAWQAMARAGDFAGLVSELLAGHYDPLYAQSLRRHDSASVHTMPMEGLDDADLGALADALLQRYGA